MGHAGQAGMTMEHISWAFDLQRSNPMGCHCMDCSHEVRVVDLCQAASVSQAGDKGVIGLRVFAAYHRSMSACEPETRKSRLFNISLPVCSPYPFPKHLVPVSLPEPPACPIPGTRSKSEVRVGPPVATTLVPSNKVRGC